MPFEMIPYTKRKSDSQYQDLLRMVHMHGEYRKQTNQGVGAISMFRPPIECRFDLRNGIPLITERKISFWRAAIGELLAFINGAVTVAEMEAFGCKWWHKWATKDLTDRAGLKEGELGPGSYGAAFHNFPTPGLENGFNQFEALVRGLREKPWGRTNLISPWVPYYASEFGKRSVVCAPCHGWIDCYVHNDMTLDLAMDQRSADIPIGVPSNMIQYAALLMMLAQVCNLTPGCFIHTFRDAHIYEDQISAVEQILDREPRQLPTLRITDPTIKDLFAFRAEHFELSDYYPHPAIADIPVAI